MKIYTATGDRGRTSLFSGERIAKDDIRIEAYGAVDELNAAVGALMAVVPEAAQQKDLLSQLAHIQSDLFRVGAWLATTPDSPSTAHLVPMTADNWQRLESQIDAMQTELETLNSFILPGGHLSAGWAHMARAVCRRAERRAVALVDAKSGNLDNILIYLNRLSDYFFVMARYCNHLAGVPEIQWHE